MNKIQYKAMYPGFYELKDGVKVTFNGIDFAYTKEDDHFVLTDINSGVRLSSVFKNEDDIYKFLEEKSDILIKSMAEEDYRKLAKRFDFLVSKEEYLDMVFLFEECIGAPVSNFYNDSVLIATKSVKFDIVKFESYLHKSNPDYYVGMSCKEFVEKKYGQELLNAIMYFMKI